MRRDQGVSRSEARNTFRKAGDLTREEIEAVLNVAYNPAMRPLSPDKIKDVTYEICVRANR